MQRYARLAFACAALLLAPLAHADAPPASPAKTRHKAKKKKDDKEKPSQGPAASSPGFRLLPDGKTRVTVEISEKVKITEHKAAGRITYRLDTVRVPLPTNRLPLLTTYFPTPVSRIQLVQNKVDTDLVIELRAPSTPSYQIVESPRGIVLQVDFPPAAPPPAPPPAR